MNTPKDNQTKKPKIGLVCNTWGKCGGMESSTIELIEGLRAIGIIPQVITKEITFDKKEGKNFEDIPVKNIPCKIVPRLFEDLYFAYRVKKQRKKLGLDFIIGCCRCPGVDLVICGGTHPGFVETKKHKNLYDRLTIFLEQKQYSLAKAIISHSQRTLDEIHRNFTNVNAIEKVIYPLFLKQLKKEKTSPIDKVKAGIPEGKTFFLFVSSSHERKGFDLLKKYFSETNLPVVLGVCGKDIGEEKLKNIVYLGFQKEMAPFYASADFTILPSKYEPFGRAPIESLLSGTPVVISDALGCNEIIKPNCKVVFEAGNYESFRKAMDTAVKKSREYKRAAQGKLEGLIENLADIPDLEGQAKLVLDLAGQITEDKESKASPEKPKS